MSQSVLDLSVASFMNAILVAPLLGAFGTAILCKILFDPRRPI